MVKKLLSSSFVLILKKRTLVLNSVLLLVNLELSKPNSYSDFFMDQELRVHIFNHILIFEVREGQFHQESRD